MASTFSGPYRWLYNKYFVDEAYDATVVEPIIQGSRTVLWRGIDAGLIDGIVNGVGYAVARTRRSSASCCSPAIYEAMRPGWCLGSVMVIICMSLMRRPPMNLLDIVLALPAIGFLADPVPAEEAHDADSSSWHS